MCTSCRPKLWHPQINWSPPWCGLSSLPPCWMAGSMNRLACPLPWRPNMVGYWLAMLILFLPLLLFLITRLSYLMTAFFISFGKWRNHLLKALFSTEEQAIVNHYEDNHSWSPEGWFIVSLPKCSNVPQLGELQSQTVKRFLNQERSLCSKGTFNSFAVVIREYFSMDHAEEVPIVDLRKPSRQVFYMPMHAIS